MAITMTEDVSSREWVVSDNPSVEFHYTLIGTSDDVVAKDFVLANTNVVYNNLPRVSTEVTPKNVDIGPDTGRWDVIVRYGLLSVPGLGDSIFSFDTSGGTQHITQSLQTISSTSATGTAPETKGAIGANGTTVAGVDIPAPVYTFTETHYFASVSEGFKGIIANLTAKVNSALFKGFQAGECLFLGAVGTRRSNLLWEITFRFSALPNRVNISIGDITVPAKLGWEYLWVKYVETQDVAAKASGMLPQAAYVEKVFELGDFSQLGI